MAGKKPSHSHSGAQSVVTAVHALSHLPPRRFNGRSSHGRNSFPIVITVAHHHIVVTIFDKIANFDDLPRQNFSNPHFVSPSLHQFHIMSLSTNKRFHDVPSTSSVRCCSSLETESPSLPYPWYLADLPQHHVTLKNVSFSGSRWYQSLIRDSAQSIS